MNHGFSTHRLQRIRGVLQGFVDRGDIAGAVTLTHRHGVEADCCAVGLQDRARNRPMQRDTIFRLASMTKPIVAAALLTLVEENAIRLYDPVDRWLPELADRRLMRDPNGSLDDVVASPRAITLHDILTYRMGIGWGPSVLRGRLFGLMAPPLAPTQNIKSEPLSPDAWMAKLGSYPLPYAPGARWLYHTAGDVAGVLLARVSGKTLEHALRERIFEPLGMRDASFFVPREKRARLAVVYANDDEKKATRLIDDAEETTWGEPPIFPSGAGGLVGTVDDFQRFGRMLLQGGKLDDVRVLSRKSVEAMTTDHLTAEQHATPFGSFDRFDVDEGQMWTHRGFGYGVSVRTQRTGLGPNVGAFTWPGAFGTSWLADPTENLMTTFLIQKVSPNPFLTQAGDDFIQTVYQAIDD